jgi:hypothetical protein
MIGFKLMVPCSTSGKASPQKIQTETPPGVEKAGGGRDGRATLARMTNPMTKISARPADVRDDDRRSLGAVVHVPAKVIE